MYYLVDTNVFLHSICDEIYEVADLCRKNETEITITNDKGRVFLHPEQNLFDDYASDIGLTVLSSEEWLNRIALPVKTGNKT